MELSITVAESPLIDLRYVLSSPSQMYTYQSTLARQEDPEFDPQHQQTLEYRTVLIGMCA